MPPAASEVRRRARYHALRGGPSAKLAPGVARTRRFLVLLFQVPVLALLALGGFPGPRLGVHALVCLFYFGALQYPRGGAPLTERIKVRMLIGGLLSYGAWLANTGGLSSPLIPLGLGMLLPALLIFDTRRQILLFTAGALGIVCAVAALSWSSVGALVAPLAPHDGHASPVFVALLVGSIVVTAMQVSSFWTHVSAAYDEVAMELGARREELCSMGEDRTRELEGAARNLAHQMKNPLASIKCLSAHLARGCSLDSKTVERLEVVSSEADRLESIVDGFLSLSRGVGQLTIERARPYEIAHALKLLLDERAKGAGVTLELVGRPDLEADVDGKKIHRALFCLMMNAVQASTAGQTVTVQVERGQIKVVDRGAGMSPDVLERLKRPPFTTRKDAAGLGVAVARTLVEQHGGSLEYESAPGRGTTAIIHLPLCPPVSSVLPALGVG